MEHCIECNQELEIRLNAFVCTYPSCPLKGLLQVGVENIEYKTFHVTNDGFEMEEKPKRCITELSVNENGENLHRIEGHNIVGNNCKDCGLHVSNDWIKKNVTDNVVISVELMKPKRWKPEEMDKYWYVSDWMEVRYSNWRDTYVDNLKFDAKNCHQTSEEAELMRDSIKALLQS